MQPAPGQECSCGDDQSGGTDDRCDDCGGALEWTLGVDGVQRRVCPHCED